MGGPRRDIEEDLFCKSKNDCRMAWMFLLFDAVPITACKEASLQELRCDGVCEMWKAREDIGCAPVSGHTSPTTVF